MAGRFAFIGLEAGTVGVQCGSTAEVRIGGAVPAAELRELVDLSYDADVARLPKAKRPVSS